MSGTYKKAYVYYMMYICLYLLGEWISQELAKDTMKFIANGCVTVEL